jgi:ankyrin repeat protein
MRHPDQQIYNWLVHTCKVPQDERDFKKRNPFTIGVDFSMIPRAENEMSGEMKDLIESGANFDLADDSGQTPYIKLYNARLFEPAEFLRSKGANIKAMSKAGIYVLKIALIRREEEEIKRLVKEGADINQRDQKERNLLHFAINMSSATADATFEIEQLLIDLGVDVNARDYLGRVPLHYAFVKIKQWNINH